MNIVEGASDDLDDAVYLYVRRLKLLLRFV